ncbi:MAG: hypothetical protein JWL73_382 [Actinomycetia bacterium]|nr:hypothetical protein [Actinomycetes bacterium]
MLAVLVAAVIGWGALLTYNARGRYRAASHTIVEITRPIAWLPGGVERAVSTRTTVQVAIVLVATLVMIDIGRRPFARRVALGALALNGSAVAVVGALGWAGILTVFHHPHGQGGTPFAAFGYHGNAAAYLDLALPAALVLVATCRSGLARVAAILATALILTGSATQASKAGLAAAVLIVLAFTVASTRRGARSPTRGAHTSRRSRTGLRVGVVVLILLVASAGAFASRSRWSELPDELGAHNGRVAVWQVAIDTWEKKIVTGSGPGSFKLLLPGVAAAQEPQLFSKWIVTDYVPGHPVTIWMVADNDPLQTLAEWGLIGALLFAAILLWPVVRGLQLRSTQHLDRAVQIGGLIALGVLYLHMLIDAPLQIFAIQLTGGLWAAILIATTDASSGSPSSDRRADSAEPVVTIFDAWPTEPEPREARMRGRGRVG